MNAMTFVVVYARFSPRPEADDSDAIDTQLDQCRAYANRQGWLVRSIYYDKEKSGDDLDRPGLWSSIDALEKDNVLMVWKLDRLARSVYLSLEIERQVAAKGARIVSICGEGTASQSPEDVLIRRILQALAEYQKAAMAIQTRMRMLRHQSQGRRMSRKDRTPYGWVNDPADEAMLVQEPTEQGIITKIREYAKELDRPRAIARVLNQARLFCRGRPWRGQMISKILKR